MAARSPKAATPPGLTDIGARWYDPVTGTFLSVDPVLKPAGPQQLGGFTYAADNPITGSDPSGLLSNPTMDGGDPGDCAQLSCQPPEVQQELAKDGVAYYAGPVKLAKKVVKDPVKLIKVFWEYQSQVPLPSKAS